MYFSLPYSREEAQITWIYSSRYARKQNQHKLALCASLNSIPTKPFSHYEAYIEYAKLLWSQEDYHEAIKSLDNMVPDGLLKYLMRKDSEIKRQDNAEPDSDNAIIDRYLAKSALLQTKWLDSSGEGKSSDIMNRYSLIARVHPQWEKGHYYMAKYYNRIYDSQLAQRPETRNKEL